MNWEDIVKKKRYPTTAQKKNKNWNNLSDEERLDVEIDRRSKGTLTRDRKRREQEIKEAKICSKCGKKDNPYKAKFCIKCGNKMQEWWKN